MDWSTVLTILQDWFAPTGIVVMAIGWWRDRRLTKVRAVKEDEGVYHQLYDDLSSTTLELSDQIRKVNGKIIVLEQALRKCHQCRYVEYCPAVIFLRSKQGEPDSHPLGVSSAERNRGNHLRAGPDEDGEPDTGTRTHEDDRQPP